MSDFGPGNTARAEPDSPGGDNVTKPTWWRDREADGKFLPKTYDPMDVGHAQTQAQPQGIPPATQETIVTESTSEPTPEQVNQNVSAFMSTLQYMANSVVKASEFATELRTLRAEFDTLRREVEAYREHNARLDEEVATLRRERATLQDENATLRADLHETKVRLEAQEVGAAAIQSDRDRIQSDWITQNDTLREVRINLSDSERKVRDLEAQVAQLTGQRDMWEREAHQSREKLEYIRNAVTSNILTGSSFAA